MRVRTCIAKYSQHINALKPENKATEMPRVSYNELSFNILLVDAQEIEKVLNIFCKSIKRFTNKIG